MSNPFKIIEPNEQAPENGREEVMGSISTMVLILRFVQLFVADSTGVILSKFKIDLDSDRPKDKNDQ